MAGRWMDEWRADNSRRGPDRERWEGSEDRSFGRDRVFGERDSGMGYNRPTRETRADYVSDDYRRDEDGDGRSDWQDRDYQGVSPGFRQHERDYEAGHPGPSRYPHPDRGYGGRLYGDTGRGRNFPEDYDHNARGRGEPQREFEDRARDAGEYLRRQGRKVANWFSDVAGEGNEMGRYENRGHRGAGPKGYKRSDERITEDVHQHLTDDHWLDASDIDVSVKDGEVTLSGSVENRDAKHRAEHLVEDLPGVTHVQNNLRSRSAGYRTTEVRGFGDGAVRTEGDGDMETSANATHTTTRK